METNSIPERVNNWMKHSVTLKLISITILILLLLIPSSMIKSIIEEREMLSEDAVQEVSAKWANAQIINGPILSIPLIYDLPVKEGSKEVLRHLNILPEDLLIDGKVNPQKLKRGIYEIVVYKSNLLLSGSFKMDKKFDQNHLKEIRWNDAFLTIGITDLRGIKDDIIVNWNDQKLKAQPGSKIRDLISSGVTINLPDGTITQGSNAKFNFDLDLQGSENLSFVPIGSTTNVKMKSDWNSPSFNGNFLPKDRNVNDEGFDATWKVLQLNRNFPQSWVNESYQTAMTNSTFGIDLILPLDDYQKSMRSAKYAVMTIALTFLIFFLVEILYDRKIHAFQYTLVGLSLCLFYVLLISISEHSNFNLAFGTSMVAIVTMITLYSLSVFKAKKISALLTVTLVGVYGFLFVTLQLADYALLLGGVGLTAILALTMYFTRNIDWYHIGNKNSVTSNAING